MTSRTAGWAGELEHNAGQLWLAELGFNARTPIFHARTKFGLEALRDALFYAFPWDEDLLTFRSARDGEWELRMFVTSARMVWGLPDHPRTHKAPLGTDYAPDCYIEGVLVEETGLTLEAQYIPVRAYLNDIRQGDPEDREGGALVQVDRYGIEMPPGTPLRKGTGTPGQPIQ